MIQKPLENNIASDPKEGRLGDEKKIQQIESIPLNQDMNAKNEDYEYNENQNINDNNSDFVNDKNFNEEVEVEEQMSNENIEQNNENENNNLNNNDKIIEIDNQNNINDDNVCNNENNIDNQNNINYNENNTENNHENENMENPQQLISAENMDESLQNYIYELQNKLNSLMNENDKLRIINQKALIALNDFKNRNIILNQKLKNLHMQNQKMNQELLKYKQVNNVNNNNIEFLNLKNQLQNYEKMIFKLSNDKKILESKIGNIQLQNTNPNQIKNINLLNYKNNQIIRSPKGRIAFTQENTMTNENNQAYKNQIMILEKNNKKLSINNAELDNQNKYLQKENQKMFVDLKKKDNCIISLSNKISEFNKEYNKQMNNFYKGNDQTQTILNQLFFEREQLINENRELKDIINQLNCKINDSSMMNKYYQSDNNDKIIKMYEDKLEDYKRKVITLKMRIQELLGIETHGNYNFTRGNSARFRHNILNLNQMKKNRSFKFNKNLNILTDFNLYNDQNRTSQNYRKIYSNFNF